MENNRDLMESSSHQFAHHHHSQHHHVKDHEYYKNKFHPNCQKHLFGFVQVETKDGEVHQGILHSYDDEKLYLLVSTQHRSGEDSRLFFPFGGFGLFGFPFFGIRRFGPFFPIIW
ncbi:MAG TPA: hypothetical protein VNR61_10150 [Niallia sp.]|nr:hypothetical protein [Niallia sp.]